MTLAPDEFIRRFLLHVLPSGFHRIRHYGLIANTTRKDNLARARELLMGAKKRMRLLMQRRTVRIPQTVVMSRRPMSARTVAHP